MPLFKSLFCFRFCVKLVLFWSAGLFAFSCFSYIAALNCIFIPPHRFLWHHGTERKEIPGSLLCVFCFVLVANLVFLLNQKFFSAISLIYTVTSDEECISSHKELRCWRRPARIENTRWCEDAIRILPEGNQTNPISSLHFLQIHWW